MFRNKARAGAMDVAWVEDKATDRAWAEEEQGIARTVHRVILAEDVDKVGVEAMATAEAWIVNKARTAVKAKALAEDKVAVGIAEAGQAVLVLIVSHLKIVTETKP